jgi:uncharacterized protein YkwD
LVHSAGIKPRASRGDNHGVGIADRDYMRGDEPSDAPGTRVARPAFVAALVVTGILTLLLSGQLGLFRGHALLSAGPTVNAGGPVRLYPNNDSWAAYLPAPKACAESTDASAPAIAAQSAMICVLDYARMRAGLTPLAVSPLLNHSAQSKAADIIRCNEFAHAACGKDPRAVADEVGYPQVSWGENIAMSPGPFAAARVAADGWLNSEHHRENLFDPRWTELGIAVVTVPVFQGQQNVAIWVSQFGERR